MELISVLAALFILIVAFFIVLSPLLCWGALKRIEKAIRDLDSRLAAQSRKDTEFLSRTTFATERIAGYQEEQ